MPTAAEKLRHGGVKRIRTVKAPGGYRRYWFFRDGTMQIGELERRNPKRKKKGHTKK